MKKYSGWVAIACITLFVSAVMARLVTAADTSTITTTLGTGGVYIQRIAWTADSSGDKEDVETSIHGNVLMVVTDPGTTAPADNYDITISDSDGVDIMGGELTNRDTATSEQVVPKIGSAYGARPVQGALTVAFTNQANADCDGEIVIYFVK